MGLEKIRNIIKDPRVTDQFLPLYYVHKGKLENPSANMVLNSDNLVSYDSDLPRDNDDEMVVEAEAGTSNENSSGEFSYTKFLFNSLQILVN